MMSSFIDKVRGLADRVEKNNVWRQRECFNLIPSESTPSLLVKMCEISDPSGRYAEHRTMKGDEVYFYQGIDFIRDIEIEAQKELGKYFNCGEVELRPISGQMANEVVFKGMVKFINRNRPQGQPSRRMRLVINNDPPLRRSGGRGDGRTGRSGARSAVARACRRASGAPTVYPAGPSA